MFKVAEQVMGLTCILGVHRLSLNWDNEYTGYIMYDFLHSVNGNNRV